MTHRVAHVIVPGRARAAGAPSGGDIYDREVCAGLAGAGWLVREHAVPGTWPRPDAAALARLAAALAAIPDGAVVLLDGLVACAAPDTVCPEAGRLRLVVLVHLPLADETGLDPAVAAALSAAERRTTHAATAVVTTSGWAARRVVDLHGLPPGRVHVAPPGVAPAPLAAGHDAGTRLLCVAALTPLKAQDVLVEALGRLADLPWSCACVGPLDRDTTYVDSVRALVRRRGLDGRVQLAGPRTGAALAAAYAAADLLVLVSHAETYGMVLTEALARGIPVVATDVGGVREALGAAGGPDRPGGLVPPDTHRESPGSAGGGRLPGLLVPPGDPAALAAALRRWLAEPGTRRELRHAARARRDTLPGWDATVRTMIGLLERAAAGSGAGTAA